MVEVTRFNFEAVIPDVEQAIRSASFIALDAEFTGLALGTNDYFSLFDSLPERYKKLRARASSFTISQIGISAFTKDKIKNSYQVKTYVFYIRPYLCGSTDKRFMCQVSCLDFLCRHGFDFNKFIKEGVPFINDVEEKKLSEELEKGSIIYLYDLLDREQDMLINDEFLGSIDQARLNTRYKNENSDSGNEGKRIVFPKDTVYPEYFQLNQIRNKYPSLWAYVEGDMVIVEEVSAKRRMELEVSSNEEKEKVVNFFLGFTRVFRLLKDAQKPIVGHNVLMDLLLCFENFYQPLPDHYEVFKKELHSLFPIIYDTRHIWRHVRKCCNLKHIPRHCGLFELYEMFKRPPDSLSTLYLPSIEIPSGSKYVEGEFRHESGYDSYITGWVFLNICHLLAMKKVKSPIFIEPQSFKQHLNAVSPFTNRVNISRSRYNFINLDGNDPPPNVPELLYIAGKNKEILDQTELSRIFSRYGIVEIKLMASKRAGLISVAAIGSFKDILRDFKDHKTFDVTKYNAFKHSPYLNSALWLTAVGSACFVAFLVMKLTSGP